MHTVRCFHNSLYAARIGGALGIRAYLWEPQSFSPQETTTTANATLGTLRTLGFWAAKHPVNAATSLVLAPAEISAEYIQKMENEKPLNPFQEVHKKVQERLARERERRELAVELRKKEAENEADRRTDDSRVSRLPKLNTSLLLRTGTPPEESVWCI
jgi:hypothetical protein